jgi:carbon monoxide dehydrogenase subunit G
MAEGAMILRIVIIVAVLIAGVLAFAATKPKTFRVQRSISINAPPEKIFALINDFHSWSGWAPQDREDSTVHRTYSGAANGKGAVSEWDSSGSAGKGRMSITESVTPRMISIKVDFVRPFAAHNINEFTLEPAGALTKVTWAMNGTNLYIMKIMSVFVSMDRVAGKHFESGLDNLKSVAEQ